MIVTDDSGSVLRVMDKNGNIQQGSERERLLDMHRATLEEVARLRLELFPPPEQQSRSVGTQLSRL